MDGEQTDRQVPGRTGNAYRPWPTRHDGGYPPGWVVRYRSRVGQTGPATRWAPLWREHVGIVAGHSLRDEHTSTTWVPVRPPGAASDEQASLVRATDIVDARPPGFGERARN
ncbi:hypothetical protein [Amycolatopsis sp. lyj-346]|uniref:hypothetical protein n=1 Tax=Amycolatopsis sp. lyj-346 TaxID=2789289 RepID=UPI00397BBBA8